MAKYTSPLDEVRVAAPCPADWEKMVGDERVRFCGSCQLNVYNLSGMSRREAEALIASADGRLCVRFYRRADGTILTRNCPVGLLALKRRASRVAGSALSALLGFFAGLGLNFGVERALSPSIMGESAVPAPPLPGDIPQIPHTPVWTAGEAALPEVRGRLVTGTYAMPPDAAADGTRGADVDAATTRRLRRAQRKR